MAQMLHPEATHHLPPFVIAPGETDVLFIVTAVFLLVTVISIGVIYFKLHALPEQMAHRGQKVQFQLVSVLALLCALVSSGCEKAKEAVAKIDPIAVSEQHCDARLPATGEVQKVPDPDRPGFCTGPAMWCSYCEYNPEGQLASSGSMPCGVCVGVETQ